MHIVKLTFHDGDLLLQELDEDIHIAPFNPESRIGPWRPPFGLKIFAGRAATRFQRKFWANCRRATRERRCDNRHSSVTLTASAITISSTLFSRKHTWPSKYDTLTPPGCRLGAQPTCTH